MFSDEFDAEETTGSWGQQKKNFYGGNPNERPHHKKHGKENEKDRDEYENELVITFFLIEIFVLFLSSTAVNSVEFTVQL